jgi:heme/copper-type cytochrome/quinol oxidase subunit 4
VIRRGNWTLYFPIATMILLSLLLTGILWLLRR